MDFETVEQKMTEAVAQVLLQDRHLLVHNLSERAIAHRLAMYLTPSFSDLTFDVDCEYNGNVDADNGRKYIYFLKDRAQKLRLLKQDEFDQELVNRNVYPDIIVHRRGKNGAENNLLIIEVKKSTSKISGAWDAEKLSRFTSSEYGNRFAYKFGAFVQFEVGDNPKYIVEWYQDGQKC